MCSCEFLQGAGVGSQVLWACRDTSAWRGIVTLDAHHLQTDCSLTDVANVETRCDLQTSSADRLLTRSQVEAMCVLSFISGPQVGVNFWPETHSANDVDRYQHLFEAFAEEACRSGVPERASDRSVHSFRVEDPSLQSPPNNEHISASDIGKGLLGHFLDEAVSGWQPGQTCLQSNDAPALGACVTSLSEHQSVISLDSREICVSHQRRAFPWSCTASLSFRQRIRSFHTRYFTPQAGRFANATYFAMATCRRWRNIQFDGGLSICNHFPHHVALGLQNFGRTASSVLLKCSAWLRGRPLPVRCCRRLQTSGKKILQKGCRGAHAARLGAMRRGALVAPWVALRSLNTKLSRSLAF